MLDARVFEGGLEIRAHPDGREATRHLVLINALDDAFVQEMAALREAAVARQVPRRAVLLVVHLLLGPPALQRAGVGRGRVPMQLDLHPFDRDVSRPGSLFLLAVFQLFLGRDVLLDLLASNDLVDYCLQITLTD